MAQMIRGIFALMLLSATAAQAELLPQVRCHGYDPVS
jgi:hypothetical protein